MPKTAKKPRPGRTGAILVEMTPAVRTMLEQIRDARGPDDDNKPLSLSQTIRWLIRAEHYRSGLKPPG